MKPDTPVSELPGVGSFYAYKLKRLNIETVEDLVYHFPFRYDDFSQISPIENVVEGQNLSVVATILEIKNIRTRFGKFITSALVSDRSGTIEIIWFNQHYLTKTLKPGIQVSLSGKVKMNGIRTQLIAPSYEIVKPGSSLPEVSQQGLTLHTGRLVPIYPETDGLSSKWLRSKIANVLPQYLATQEDFLPEEIKKSQKLPDLEKALTKIHFPQNLDDAKISRQRLAFDELFLTQLAAQIRKRDWQTKKLAHKMSVDKSKLQKLISSLPFKLTGAQERAVGEITSDLQKNTPANRLLEGDVGSGKTVVGAAASYISHLNGFDSIFAAPTEILAFQHQKTLKEILEPFGLKIGIWTASRKEQGDLIVGTHALLFNFQSKQEIGFVIVDEQHRFGVAQRTKLFQGDSKKYLPHLLTMTATPIPRTLALTLYGDLDLSILDEMPKGRVKIDTFVVPNFKRNDAYKFIEKQIATGNQTYIITPFVEPSETMSSVKSATVEFEKLKLKFTKGTKMGLLHGRLKSGEKEKVIDDFSTSKIQVLVSTPVVEVGIDVPNATVMMIESAERFGLAQLHQLRGRVGRSSQKSYCLLFTDSSLENSLKRLKSMQTVHVGFELAEIDLKMRGPGEIFGLMQSGFSNLKLADITDRNLVNVTQNQAQKLMDKDPNLKKYPLLNEKLKKLQNEFASPN